MEITIQYKYVVPLVPYSYNNGYFLTVRLDSFLTIQ